VDLPAKLAELPCVDALAYAAGPERVRVRRAAGQVEFHQADGPGGAITYRVISGQDPLGWNSAVPDEALAGKGLTPRQWLVATANTDYPDLPAQILAYFRGRTAGDIALFAAPTWDFNRVNRSGHGGLRGGDMHVPLLLAGPGIPPVRLPVARTADVMPTILTLLGRPVPPGLDGQSLVTVLPPATQPGDRKQRTTARAAPATQVTSSPSPVAGSRAETAEDEDDDEDDYETRHGAMPLPRAGHLQCPVPGPLPHAKQSPLQNPIQPPVSS
jgi:hypothetical protein